MQNSKFKAMLRKINFYPPFLGMGIAVKSYNEEFTRFEVELKSRWYNRNLFGTHFGGSLFSMCDPFFVAIVTMNFGRGYVVWDKSASIDFLKPSARTVVGVFEISKTRLHDMQKEVNALGKNTYHFEATLRDDAGQNVARITKEVYIRAKKAAFESR